MTFNFAQFRTTSTVINCNIDAFIEMHLLSLKQKIEYVLFNKKSGNNYSHKEASQEYLIANDENGNVKLREVVSFKSNDSDKIIIILK